MARRKPTDQERTRGIIVLQLSSAVVWVFAVLFSSLVARGTDLSEVTALAGFSLNDALEFVFGAIIAIFLLSVFRDKKTLGTLVSLVLGLLIWSGVTLIGSSTLGIVLALVLILWEKFKHSFLSHNALVLIAVLFTAIPIGLLYSVNLLIIFLIFVTVYDIVGVFGTNFIPRLAVSAIKQDAPLLISAPRKKTSWSEAPTIDNAAAILGAGDILVPALFISTVTFAEGPLFGISIFAGAMLGMLADTLLAMKAKQGIPAVPLLVGGMLLAYALTFLFV